MPLINVKISNSEVNNPEKLMQEISSKLANLTGKPESYVMTILQTDALMTFAGSSEACCFAEIKSIGSLKPSVMTEAFCNLIESRTGIPSNRIYIEFTDVEGRNWGFNKNTFG